MALNYANNQSLSNITALPAGISGGALTLLQTQTASSSATIDFTSNIDSTYDAYMFKFYDIHPATDDTEFSFNGSTDGGSNYNITKTTTNFRSYHKEDDSSTQLTYLTSDDLAQSTGFQKLSSPVGNGNDENCVGTIIIYKPSDTTFVKHFISRFQTYFFNDSSSENYVAGYFNTTSAINAIQFKFTSGNTDTGTIKLYGVS